MADLAFKVDPAALAVQSYVHVLYGTKDPSIVSMTVNDITGRITFPTASLWRLELVLTAGLNTYKLRGKDSVDNWTATTTVELELPSYTADAHSYFNVLDEHSLLVGLARNPGEKGWDFRNRLLSFAQARTGAHIEGLFLAYAHELGIKPTEEALSVKVKRDAYAQLPSETVYFEITPVAVLVDAEELIQDREPHLVEPRDRSVMLDYAPLAADLVRIFDSEGNQVSDLHFSVDVANSKITFDSDDFNRNWVVARYPYRYSIDHRALTLTQLKTQLEAITVGGAQLLDVTVDTGTLTAYGLMRVYRQLLTDEDLHIQHARVQVTGLDNKDWQESLLNSFGTAHGTKLETYARRSAEKSNIGWDNLILDEGIWDEDADNRALDYLPRLWDAVFGRWYCNYPGCTAVYNLLEYRLWNGYCPIHPESALVYRGVAEELIQSGVGAPDDLYAISEEIPEEI